MCWQRSIAGRWFRVRLISFASMWNLSYRLLMITLHFSRSRIGFLVYLSAYLSIGPSLLVFFIWNCLLPLLSHLLAGVLREKERLVSLQESSQHCCDVVIRRCGKVNNSQWTTSHHRRVSVLLWTESRVPLIAKQDNRLVQCALHNCCNQPHNV